MFNWWTGLFAAEKADAFETERKAELAAYTVFANYLRSPIVCHRPELMPRLEAIGRSSAGMRGVLAAIENQFLLPVPRIVDAKSNPDVYKQISALMKAIEANG